MLENANIPLWAKVVLVVIFAEIMRKILISKEKQREEVASKDRNNGKPEIRVVVTEQKWKCPACDSTQPEMYDTCSQCGQPITK